MSRSIGREAVLVVRLDGLDHEIEFVGAVDLPGDAVVFAWRNDSGFGEVIQTVNPSSRVVFHDEHSTAFAFRPREQEEVIGAEVEHGLRGKDGDGSRSSRAPLAAPLWS